MAFLCDDDNCQDVISAWVDCACGIKSNERPTEAEAVEQWNTRTPPSDVTVRVEEIETLPAAKVDAGVREEMARSMALADSRKLILETSDHTQLGHASDSDWKEYLHMVDAVLASHPLVSVDQKRLNSESDHQTEQTDARLSDHMAELRGIFADANLVEFAKFPLIGHGIDAHRREWAKDANGRKVLECGEHGYGMLYDFIDVLNTAYKIAQLTTRPDVQPQSNNASGASSESRTVRVEEIARIIDPHAFESWQSQFEYSRKSDGEDFARRCADCYYKSACDAATERATAILSLLSGKGST